MAAAAATKLSQVLEDNPDTASRHNGHSHTGDTVQMAGHAGTAAMAHTSTAAEAELEDEGGMAAVGAHPAAIAPTGSDPAIGFSPDKSICRGPVSRSCVLYAHLCRM